MLKASGWILWLYCWHWSCCSSFFANGWVITAPTTQADWKQISSLVVQTFDAPEDEASILDQLKWNVVERSLWEASTYRYFVANAKRMQGKKYAILVAKDESGIIGMAELGVNVGTEGEKRVTIGNICVSRSFRKVGVGYALVSKCLEIGLQHWGDERICAEVEQTNLQAIALFQACGFEYTSETTTMVTLRRRGRTLEERPHLLLCYCCVESKQE
jgi:ribosomal protein S18 acetylase RimI-like enzyme